MQWIDVSLKQGDSNHILQNINFNDKEEVYGTVDYLISKCIEFLDEISELEDKIYELESEEE